jgi:hypothetical protein
MSTGASDPRPETKIGDPEYRERLWSRPVMKPPPEPTTYLARLMAGLPTGPVPERLARELRQAAGSATLNRSVRLTPIAWYDLEPVKALRVDPVTSTWRAPRASGT